MIPCHLKYATLVHRHDPLYTASSSAQKVSVTTLSPGGRSWVVNTPASPVARSSHCSVVSKRRRIAFHRRSQEPVRTAWTPGMPCQLALFAALLPGKPVALMDELSPKSPWDPAATFDPDGRASCHTRPTRSATNPRSAGVAILRSPLCLRCRRRPVAGWTGA